MIKFHYNFKNLFKFILIIHLNFMVSIIIFILVKEDIYFFIQFLTIVNLINLLRSFIALVIFN